MMSGATPGISLNVARCVMATIVLPDRGSAEFIRPANISKTSFAGPGGSER